MHLIQAEADKASRFEQGLKPAIIEMVTSHMLEITMSSWTKLTRWKVFWPVQSSSETETKKDGNLTRSKITRIIRGSR